MTTPPIATYTLQPASYHPYDAAAPVVAGRLVGLITTANSRLHIEHIGSSAVPGCGGKGYIDLLVVYPAGLLAEAQETLDRLGFQRQGGRAW